MADVFLSYTKADKAAAEKVAGTLSSLGKTVFYDVEIATGDIWDTRIEAELNASKAVAVLWSAASRKRDWVRNEARLGSERGILFPARLDNCKIPIEFTHIQTADLRRLDVISLNQYCGHICSKLGDEATIAAAPATGDSLPHHLHLRLSEEVERAGQLHQKFSLSNLHPEVAAACEVARRAELAAIRARYRALHSQELAEESARLARAGHQRTIVVTLSDGDLYEGDHAGERGLLLKLTGFGIKTMTALGDFKGDRYSGQFQGGRFTGTGVYVYGRNSNNRNSLRYEGELSQDMKSGFGVYLWRSGDRYSGSFADDQVNGVGVHQFADGRRQEGYSLNWFSDGHCAEWSPDGSVRAGIWSRNRLLRSLP